MASVPDGFEFQYRGSDVVYGRGAVTRLASLLERHGLESALVVCGSNVGANDAVMDPVRRGLGDRLAGVFDGTTPAKTIASVFAGVESMRETDPDVLVGVGGGSSLDTARQMSVFAADGRPQSAYVEAARAGRVEAPAPDEPVTPVVVVPTTFAGADLASGGSVVTLPAEESPTGQPVKSGGLVSPTAMLYDPALFETTPDGPLAGSAMNGFDKGIETIYDRSATPVTDATAVRGLRFLRESLPRLGSDPDAMDRAVAGLVLVQYERRTSVVHAFGHGFARRYPVQQGVAHAVLVPHVLRFVLERVDARRDVLAEGLGVGDGRGGDARDGGDAGLDDHELAESIVAAVTRVRDALDLPTRLRDLDPVREADLPAIASFVVDDVPMEHAPAGLELTEGDVESILRAAW